MADRKPPLIRCRCGRQHRSWNPHKVCSRCVRESRAAVDEAVVAQVAAQDERRANPDRERLAAVHARWLARQSLDHPWRVAAGGGEA